MRLLTIQKPDIDLTTDVEPTDFYTDPKGPYYELSYRFGWEKWIWCVLDMAIFLEDCMRISEKYCIWVLDVPEDHITWGSLERYLEGNTPSTTIFHSKDFIKQALGDTPMGLVPVPVKTEWVLGKWFVEPCNEKGRKETQDDRQTDLWK